MRAQGSCSEEFVDKSFSDAEADATSAILLETVLLLRIFILPNNAPFKDKVLGQLNSFLGSDDLNGFILGLVARDLDLAVALLADSVNLGAVGADNMSVSARIGEDKITGSVALLGLFKSLGDSILGLLDVLR
ncbi:hypothetical protein HG531_010125 [Fusarium graminearum]|nr:hypothetical protein HG531_010125 [Fusarium graminearum]